VTLDLLGKEHQALVAAGQAVHRILVWELILSLGALALCLGWITIDPHLSFAGMIISVPQTGLLVGLAATISLLFWRSGSLNVYGGWYRRSIASLYEALGCSDHVDRTGGTRFMYPDFVVVAGVVLNKAQPYLLKQLRERPIQRGAGMLLTSCCWAITILVWVVIRQGIHLLPLIVDWFVAGYMWQHHTNPYLIAAMLFLLLLIYIAGEWQYRVSQDDWGGRFRARLARKEVWEALHEWGRDLRAASAMSVAKKGVATAGSSGAPPDEQEADTA
jgi:hypothetical protein